MLWQVRVPAKATIDELENQSAHLMGYTLLSCSVLHWHDLLDG
jgi:hypothetical protein